MENLQEQILKMFGKFNTLVNGIFKTQSVKRRISS